MAISMISQDEQRNENSTECSLSRSSSKDSALPRDSIQSPTLADQMARWVVQVLDTREKLPTRAVRWSVCMRGALR